MIDPERAQWLRALRTMNDAYVLELLDEAMRQAKDDAWCEGFEYARRRLLLPGRQPIPETRRWVVVIGDPTE